MRWKKKLMKSLSLREYFWPPQWARSRIDKLVQNAGKNITKPSTVTLSGDVSVQVGAGDDSVEVGNSQMDFLDGFDYVCQVMQELQFDPQEIASRKEFVRWLFWHSSLNEKARMACAEKFLIRYHTHPNWMVAAKEETFIWMEGINLTSGFSKSGGTSSGSKSSPKRNVRKRRQGSGSANGQKHHQSSSRDKNHYRSKESSEREQSATARSPPEGRIQGVCDSRIQKGLSCRFERNGGDGSECRFSHVCPRCPGVNHSAAQCGKI